MHRRSFLGGAIGAGAGLLGFPLVVSRSAFGSAARAAPSDLVAVGCIGVGPRGRDVMEGFLGNKDARIVAVCDVKAWVRDDAARHVDQRYQSAGCATYGDFRELLERADIDAVSSATCDHWHVLTALAAARSGKDVYLEKPMGLCMAECIALREAMHRYGRVFQFGTQQRSEGHFRRACELALNERIGKVHTINVWSPGSSRGGSFEPEPVPKGLDYEMWLGPAPYVPYTKDRCSNSLWWFISDYALGFIAGWGIHPMDIASWGAGAGFDSAVSVEGKGEFPTEGVADTATNWFLTYKFANGLTMHFAGDPRPAEWAARYPTSTSHGTAFEGKDGWVHVHRGVLDSSPAEVVKADRASEKIKLYESGNHVGNFVECVRTRRRAVCDIDEAVRSETFCQIGEIALRLGRKVVWDPATECFLGDEAANRMLSRAMRGPWKL